MIVSAPGKLVIAGEWAVLEGHQAIVAAVNRRATSSIEPLAGNFISLTMDDFRVRDVRFSWREGALRVFRTHEGAETAFARSAMETALSFLDAEGIAFRPFKIRAASGGFRGERKFGFGSSAAATVAIISSVLSFHGYGATKDDVFRLAARAHYRAQGSAGSGIDIAASVYGGIIAYRRFDPGMLSSDIRTRWRVAVRKLPLPRLKLLVVWTGSEASTTQLMKAMDAFKEAHRTAYERVLAGIGSVVDELVDVWNDEDDDAVLRLLRKNGALLGELTKRSGVPVETAAFKRLASIADTEGAAGKLSGAGGGDCGIVLCRDAARMRSALAQEFTLVDVLVDTDGVREEDAPR